MGLFTDRKVYEDGKTGVPVWFMRQAGRYHDHYQQIKKTSNFMEMCKTPTLARDVTMGPIEEFHFDAAILFSDLLFPLEQMGLGLTYAPGPKLEKHLKQLSDVEGLKFTAAPAEFYSFQKDACALLKESLPKEVTLLGFVGAPWTLYTYAVEGGHSGNLIDPKKGLYDGRWQKFCEKLQENLLEEMNQQVQGGADAICLFDTAAGECGFTEYTQDILPQIKSITKAFKQKHPNTRIIYYSKFTHLHYLEAIEDENIDVLGIDWRMDLGTCLKRLGNDYMIQGNFDPALLHLPWEQLEKKLENWWSELKEQNLPLDRWICGLGHGVLQHTPEQNVFKAVEYIHNNFRY
jgi:uroporphyrinogen decarboxylase